MNTIQRGNTDKKFSWGLIGAVVAAVATATCCIVPILLLMLGISGAWIGNLTALHAYRPVFVGVTLVALGFAFYSIYRKPKPQTDDEDCDCSIPEQKRMKMKKIVLWVCTALIFGLLAFPYFVPYVFAQGIEEVQTKEVVLEVQNMTCGTCPIVVKKSLTRLKGVEEAKVTLRPPEATIVYDPDKVTVEDLIEATTNVGYPSAKKESGR